jgi:hypothetical protein
MRLLIVCDEGLNRSGTIRGQLQYWGHDCLTIGLNRNSPETIALLAAWADLIILTAQDQTARLTATDTPTQLWDVGPDNYPRPYNPKLLHRGCPFICVGGG